jgi:hypothetical protein
MTAQGDKRCNLVAGHAQRSQHMVDTFQPSFELWLDDLVGPGLPEDLDIVS